MIGPLGMIDSVYEERAVLFLDILGFSKLIEDGRESEILEALEIGEDIKRKSQIDNFNTLEISSFSDSVIVSENIGDGTGIVQIVHYAGFLVWKFLNLGILTRGGIAIGKMHHKKGVVFGPALVEAHRLESKHAIYPRIVTSSDVFHGYIRREAIIRPEYVGVMQTIFREDFDSQLHINIFSDVCSGQPEKFIVRRQIVGSSGFSNTANASRSARRKCIDAALLKNSSTIPEHLVKLGWLKKYAESTDVA